MKDYLKYNVKQMFLFSDFVGIHLLQKFSVFAVVFSTSWCSLKLKFLDMEIWLIQIDNLCKVIQEVNSNFWEKNLLYIEYCRSKNRWRKIPRKNLIFNWVVEFILMLDLQINSYVAISLKLQGYRCYLTITFLK